MEMKEIAKKISQTSQKRLDNLEKSDITILSDFYKWGMSFKISYD
jgi:hypothetical protein